MEAKVRAGLYVRTSRDEENKTNRNSIQNQIDGLKKYCESSNYEIIKIYVDENYTGSNFERPKFKEMMEDAKSKMINTIITKDLSRLGRNLYKMGEYLEDIFPSMNIRYIAITDDVDTNKGINEEVIYKNFFNDLYIKDVVKKLKFSLKNKAKTKPLSCRKGLCFGYEEGEKGEWVVNFEEAEIVKRIFREYLAGTSMYKITKDLKNDKIMTASYRKYFKYGDMNNIKHRGPKPNPEYYYLWDVSTITYILRNKQYIGVVVNNIAGEKIILENHHQPIITKADFEKVQEKMKHNKAFGANSYNPMNNLVKCKCCDFAMVKNYYGKHSDVYQCIKCKMWIETSDVENIIKTEVEKRLESKESTLTGNALAKEKHKILSKINRIENELTKLILEDADNNIIEGFNLKLKELRDNLTNLSTKPNIIFDLNGNQLTQEELKDYRKLAKILFKKVYFKKENNEIKSEFIER